MAEQPASDNATAASAIQKSSSDAVACANDATPFRCCCGSLECVFLKHNESILSGLEKNIHKAGKYGQALLERHEAYMADSERDRTELTAHIEQLGADNRELEAKNAKTVEENRQLLDQLEEMNTAVVDSEDQIKSLEASLLSSQQAIRRLESDTARAAELERQLVLLEHEQAELHSHLFLSREDVRSATSRWKRAERNIQDLQDQLDVMEKQASEERKQHVDTIARFKQKKEEEMLQTAAGRLKGHAALKSLTDHGAVAELVGGLFASNASFQFEIAELHQQLDQHKNVIQTLENQLAYHQPVIEDADEDLPPVEGPSLMAELEDQDTIRRSSSPRLSQELHVHHHYHVQKQEVKKPKKKRQGLTPGVFAPPPGSATSTPPNGPARHSLPHHGRESRWSIHSEQFSVAPSSVPSSPRSGHRNSALFDPMGDPFPGSPTTSIDPMSPTWRATHRKQNSSMSSRSFRVPTHFALTPSTPAPAEPIEEETGDWDGPPDLTMNTDDSAAGDDELSSRDPDASNDDVSIIVEDTDEGERRITRLRRAMSQESIMSLSGGLDIHTLKSRPSQLTLRHLPSTMTLTASSSVTARPMLTREGSQRRSSAMLRDSYASSSASSLRSISNPVTPRPTPSSASSSSTLGKLTGWRPWGGGGTSGAHTVHEKDTAKDFGRSPGINQPGSIPGFTQFLAAAQKKPIPTQISPEVVDRDALREGLSE